MGLEGRRGDLWKIAGLDALAIATILIMRTSEEALDLFHAVFWVMIAEAFFLVSWGFWVRMGLALAGVEFLLLRAGDAPWQDVAEPFVLASIAAMVFFMHRGRERARVALRQQATHDPLTGLLNRRALQGSLEDAVDKLDRERTSFGVIYIDLDGFKSVNDEHGHDVGDAVLTNTARRIENATRKTDSSGRIGGDEFAVILSTPTTPAEAEVIARRLSDELSVPFVVGEARISLSASMGIAMATAEESRTPQQLLIDADRAMYDVKRRARGTYAFASPSES